MANEFIARNGLIAQNNSTVSGSLTVTAGITGSLFGSASYATTAATASYANNFTVAGTLTAQTLVVQTITSSTVYSSGSNIFGNALANTQTFTGSMYQTGSVAAFMGNVGIGTTSPGYKLHVSGGDATLNNAFIGEVSGYGAGNTQFSHISRAGAGEYSFLSANDGTTYINSKTGYNIHFRVNNSSVATINSSGDLLVGTTTSTWNNSGRGIVQVNGSSTALIGLSISDSAKAYLYHNGGDLALYTYTGNINFQNSNGSVLSVSGTNVGIGTTSPATKLQVVGGYISTKDNAAYGGAFMEGENGTTYFGALGTDDVQFYLYDQTRMIIKQSTGNVGIGTTNPLAKLQVAGALGSTVGQGGSTIRLLNTDTGAAASITAGITGVTNEGMQFSTDGTARMVINNGNVGINTTSPGYKLDVNGDGRFTGGLNLTSENPQLTFTDTTSGEDDMVLSMNGDYLEFLSNALRNIITVHGETSAYSGSVGIGTSAPLSKLHVYSGAGAGDYAAYIQNTGAGNGLKIYNADWDVTDYLLYTSNGGSYVTVIDGNGKVGIGTATPGAKLDVLSTGEVSVFRSSNTTLYVTYRANGTDVGYIGNGIGVIGGGSATDFGFQSINNTVFSTGGSGLERMRITSGGDLLIGTSTSTYGTSNRGVVQVNGASTAIFGLTTGGTDSGYLYHTGTDMLVWNTKAGYTAIGTNNTERVRVTSAGNVGIGTTNPAEKLQVTGQILMSGTTNASAYLGGIASSWGGDAQYPTLYGSDVARWVMHINPHISYVVSGSNGYAGSMTGATVRFASDTAATTYWDHGIGVNSVGVDRYSIGRAGTSLMAISSSGAVGIGSTAPNSKLEVKGADDSTTQAIFQAVGSGNAAYNGGIQLGNASSNQNSKIYHSSAGDNTLAFVSSYSGGTANKFTFAPGGTETVRFQQNGNVGIGITNPSNLLNTFIASGAGAFSKGVRISTGDGSFTAGHGGMLEFQNEDVMTAGIRGIRQSGWGSSLAFYVHNTSSGNTFGSTFVERMRIAEDGNVGIGTSDPTSQMSGTSGIGIYHASYPAVGFKNSTTSWLWYGEGATFKMWNASAGDILTGTSGGRIGIGTTSPGAKLHVVAGSSSDTSLILDHGSSTYRTYFGFDGTGNYIETNGGTTATQKLRLQVFNGSAYTQLFVDGGNERIYTSANANVGIGTTNPGYKLEISGSSLTTGAIRIAGTEPFYFNSYGGGWYMSDSTWIRGYGGKSLWMDTGVIGNDGGLTIGYGGVAPASGYAIIAGRVGIGTTNPGHKLQVVGAVGIGQNTNGTATIDAYGGNAYYGCDGTQITVVGTSGNVGIGSTAPTQGKLVVNGGVYATSFTGSLLGTATSASYAGAYLPLAGGTMAGTLAMDSQILSFNQSGTRSWNIQASGGELNFFSGDGAGVYDFDYVAMAGTAFQAPTYYSTFTGSRSKIRLWGTDTEYAIGFTSGVTFGGLNDYAITTQVNNDSTRGFWWGHTDQTLAQGAMALTTDGNLTVAARIRVGYGTSDTTTPSTYAIQASGDVNITGTLTAAVKSFVIDHPTKADKKLQYGVLEGPEHSVYVRGKLKNTNYIPLPDYWHALVHQDSITVTITAIGKKQDIWVNEVTEHGIYLGYEGNTIEYFYSVFAERKDIDKLVTEFDKEV